MTTETPETPESPAESETVIATMSPEVATEGKGTGKSAKPLVDKVQAKAILAEIGAAKTKEEAKALGKKLAALVDRDQMKSMMKDAQDAALAGGHGPVGPEEFEAMKAKIKANIKPKIKAQMREMFAEQASA
jgi:hypothetical protein